MYMMTGQQRPIGKKQNYVKIPEKAEAALATSNAPSTLR